MGEIISNDLPLNFPRPGANLRAPLARRRVTSAPAFLFLAFFHAAGAGISPGCIASYETRHGRPLQFAGISPGAFQVTKLDTGGPGLMPAPATLSDCDIKKKIKREMPYSHFHF